MSDVVDTANVRKPLFKLNWPVLITVFLLIFALFFASLSLHVIVSRREGSYLLTSIHASFIDFIIQAISTLQAAAFFLWITVCFFIVLWSGYKIKIVGLLILITFIVAVAFIISVWFPFTLVETRIVSDKSYNIGHIYDGDDGVGYYTFLECDRIGLFCSRLYRSDHGYAGLETNAHIEVDESTKEVILVIEGEAVYRIQVMPQ